MEVIEDPKEGETLEALKDLWLWDSPAAKKQITMIASGKQMKVLSTELKEGVGNAGFIKVEALKCEGWVTIWAKGGTTGTGPKTGFVKRIGGGPAETLAKAEPAAAQTEEKAMGA